MAQGDRRHGYPPWKRGVLNAMVCGRPSSIKADWTGSQAQYSVRGVASITGVDGTIGQKRATWKREISFSQLDVRVTCRLPPGPFALQRPAATLTLNADAAPPERHDHQLLFLIFHRADHDQSTKPFLHAFLLCPPRPDRLQPERQRRRRTGTKTRRRKTAR